MLLWRWALSWLLRWQASVCCALAAQLQAPDIGELRCKDCSIIAAAATPLPLHPALLFCTTAEGRRLAHVAATRPRRRHLISWPRCWVGPGGSLHNDELEHRNEFGSPSEFLRPVLELAERQPWVVEVERAP